MKETACIFTGGLGDILHQIYCRDHYIKLTNQKTHIIVGSLNPYAQEFFLYHEHAENFILYNLQAKYKKLCLAGLIAEQVEHELCSFVGLTRTPFVLANHATPFTPKFFAPDNLISSDYIVLAPFSSQTLTAIPPAITKHICLSLTERKLKTYLVGRDYPNQDELSTVSLLKSDYVIPINLSVPATINLVQNAKSVIAGWSCIAHAAWFANKPTILIYEKNSPIIQSNIKSHLAFGFFRPTTKAISVNEYNNILEYL